MFGSPLLDHLLFDMIKGIKKIKIENDIFSFNFLNSPQSCHLFKVCLTIYVFYFMNICFLIILSKILAQAISNAFFVAIDIVD